MERANIPEAKRVPVFLYLDEFETMASESFEAIVAEGHRFGLGLCLSHQNGHQIPTNLRHVLRNNVHTQLYFQTGAMDAADLCSEIANGQTKDEARSALIGQKVGEAFLVRRGSPTQRVRIALSPDSGVDLGAVAAVRHAALQAFGVPRADVERELQDRAAHIRRLSDGPAVTPKIEVRDVQAPKAQGRRRA